MIELAIWFHDSVYDARAGDNEEKSAALAQEYLSDAIDVPQLSLVEEMIQATKSHGGEGGDVALMVDIDLGILGRSPERFQRYENDIRKEYS